MYDTYSFGPLSLFCVEWRSGSRVSSLLSFPLLLSLVPCRSVPLDRRVLFGVHGHSFLPCSGRDPRLPLVSFCRILLPSVVVGGGVRCTMVGPTGVRSRSRKSTSALFVRPLEPQDLSSLVSAPNPGYPLPSSQFLPTVTPWVLRPPLLLRPPRGHVSRLRRLSCLKRVVPTVPGTWTR